MSARIPTTPASHKPYSFLREELRGDSAAQFVALTMDVARGLQVCIEMTSASNLTREMNEDCNAGDEESPTLDSVDTDYLTRFAAATACLLANHASDRLDWLNKYGVKERK
ncbi:hypothetical protein RCH14_002255 [Massilia sp. MP_M2]|uniref:hypothetical protein n=1 Tax=Massilia sp. MP_M2 TaxID=3071713 RepID=UPI00319E63F5